MLLRFAVDTTAIATVWVKIASDRVRLLSWTWSRHHMCSMHKYRHVDKGAVACTYQDIAAVSGLRAG
jgi:hypothetical protein